jgi:hypothetical protein
MERPQSGYGGVGSGKCPAKDQTCFTTLLEAWRVGGPSRGPTQDLGKSDKNPPVPTRISKKAAKMCKN